MTAESGYRRFRAWLNETSLAVRAARASTRFVNHDLPALVRPRRPREPAPSAGRTPFDETAPTYPYAPTAEEPLAPRPDPMVRNPVLTAADVTDFGDAWFVADPFLFVENGDYHLFFEVANENRDPDAVIGHATSPDGREWRYDRVVLDTGRHLSFPYVFKFEGRYFMLPEQGGVKGGAVVLYEAESFPTDWTERAVLVAPDHRTDDAVVFRWADRWWMVVGESTRRDNRLWVYHSDALAEGWSAHRDNPVVTDRPRATRPAGRPIVRDDRVVMFYQDCVARYGHRVRAYEITDLTPETYTDRERPESPVLEATGEFAGWNAGAMHTIDPWYVDGRWLCAVDGNVAFGYDTLSKHHWAIGMYVAGDDGNAARTGVTR